MLLFGLPNMFAWNRILARFFNGTTVPTQHPQPKGNFIVPLLLLLSEELTANDEGNL